MVQFTTTLQQPTAPDLSVVLGNQTQGIKASWIDVIDNGQYRIQLREQGTSWFAEEATVGQNTTEHTFTNLVEGVVYEVRLRAETDDVTTDWTDTVSQDTFSPFDFLRVQRRGTYVDLEWETNISTGDGLFIYRTFENEPIFPEDYEIVADLGFTEERYTEGLWGGEDVTYAITAYDSNGNESSEETDYFDPCADEDLTRDLVGGLPGYYPSSERSSNYDLLEPIGERLCNHEAIIDVIDDASGVQTARDMEELEALGELIQTYPREGESLEHYRARLIAEYALSSGTGTIRSLLETAAGILDVQPSSITFSEPAGGENGTAQLGLPAQAIDDTDLTENDLIDILDRLIAAGYRLTAQIIGTLVYISPADYAADNHDPAKGYDGLDNGGEPKDNGGTYAGLIT